MGRRMEDDTGRGYKGPDHFCPSTGVYIIADAGSNHCGDIKLAYQLIDDARESAVDAIKFQLFRVRDILKDDSLDEAWELPVHWLPSLADYAHQCGLDFLCTPFAPWAVATLAPYVDAWKIGSFEAMRSDIYDAIKDSDYRTKIVSMGMCSDKDLWRFRGDHPDAILLHCTSHYPTGVEESQLFRMRPQKLYGFSDHTVNPPAAACAAVALGARTIERHIRLYDQPNSPDDGEWSIPQEEFLPYSLRLREMAEAMRIAEFKPADPPPGRLVHGR